MQEYEQDAKPKKKSLFNLDFIFLKMSSVSKQPTESSDIDTVGFKQAQPEKSVEDLKNLKEIQDQNSKVIEQQIQANKFLKANLYKLYFSMVDHGYKPTQEQQDFINTDIKNIFVKMNKDFKQFNHIHNFIKQGYKLTENDAYEIISNKHFQSAFFCEELFNPNIDYIDFMQNKKSSGEDNNVEANNKHKSLVFNDFVPVFEQLRSLIFTEKFSKIIANKVLMSMKSNIDYDEEDSYYYESEDYAHSQYPFFIKDLFNAAKFLEHIPHLVLPSVTLNKLINFMTEVKEKEYYIDSMYDNSKSGYKQYLTHSQYSVKNHLYDLCNNLLDTHFSKDVTNLLDNTKLVYSNAYLEEKALKTTTVLADNYKVHNLPQSSQYLIKDIQFVYTQLQNHKSSFTDEQLFTINNIFDKRVPEVLQKYFSIDLDYRTNMKNLEGKNAQELMNDSLTNFKQKLTETLDSINELKLNDLSVSKRYSQKI